MIQRIQSIFLFLAAVSFGILFVLPMASSNKIATDFFSDQVYTITDHPVLLILTITGILVALIAIFLYANRSLQVKLGYLVLLLAISLPLTAFLLLSNQTTAMDSAVQVNNQPGFLVPLGALLFGALAIFNIRKDDKLVKSMDRLR